MADTKVIVDCATGETKVVELTAQEIAARDQQAAAFAEEQEAREVEAARIAALKVSAKAKLVAGEALTADEAAVLVI